jgi:hypothetical protein
VRLLGKLARHRVLDRLDLVRGLLISICADLSLYVVGILSEELLGGRGQEPGDVPLVQGLEDLVGLADDADLPPAGSGRPLDPAHRRSERGISVRKARRRLRVLVRHLVRTALVLALALWLWPRQTPKRRIESDPVPSADVSAPRGADTS